MLCAVKVQHTLSYQILVLFIIFEILLFKLNWTLPSYTFHQPSAKTLATILQTDVSNFLSSRSWASLRIKSDSLDPYWHSVCLVAISSLRSDLKKLCILQPKNGYALQRIQHHSKSCMGNCSIWSHHRTGRSESPPELLTLPYSALGNNSDCETGICAIATNIQSIDQKIHPIAIAVLSLPAKAAYNLKCRNVFN